jgi:hypothetical protein
MAWVIKDMISLLMFIILRDKEALFIFVNIIITQF